MNSPLHQGWTVGATRGPVPAELAGLRLGATVPGCVTTDLLSAGLVPDPYLDANEVLLAWVGRVAWRYDLDFGAAPALPGERVDLVFEGLDTVATVRLNGTELGRVADMHMAHRFDVGGLLVAEGNHLEVELEPALDAAQEWEARLGARPNVSAHPYNALRKMACNYGWDWGPDLPTSGIWKPVSLQRWATARIAAVRPLSWVLLDGPGGPRTPTMVEHEAPAADAGSPTAAPAVLEAHVELERPVPGQGPALRVTVSVAGGTAEAVVAPGVGEATVRLDLDRVELWWPRGYGDQPLYDLDVVLESADEGDRLDHWACRTGFRSVQLDTGQDGRGSRLGFVVNGRAVAIRGANWIPDDCFPTRVDEQRYRGRLAQAVRANMNLLRVWGGGLFESEDFYRLADEMGLLVWQDFLLACAAYAEEPPLGPLMEAEARQAVTRLCPHPSLAVWSGGNENIWGHEDWGWKEQLAERTWGAGYYYEVFPSLVAELDPTRPYMAGSPWSFRTDVHPNDPRYGSMHVWDVWNERDYLAYREHQPQFVSEFGFQGPPTWSTLARAISTRPLSTSLPEMAVHQKAVAGNEKLARWSGLRFPVPRSFEDWHWATSLVQARAVALGVEHWRAQVPRCRGVIVWQLNDCWPVVSWAAVDGDGRLKPLWYELRRAYRDRLLTLQPAGPAEAGGPADGRLVLAAVNDGPTPWAVEVDLARAGFDGEVLERSRLSLVVAPGSVERALLAEELTRPTRPQAELLVARAGDERALWFYGEDKDLELPAPDLSAGWRRTPDGYDVELGARSLQRDVALLADKAHPEAESDDMVFTLLAGEARTVHVRCPELADPSVLVGPAVLRSANQLVQGG